MIARLEGQIIKKFKESIVLDVHGVGYQVLVPSSLMAELKEFDRLQLWTAQVFREKEVSLYGFGDFNTRRLFELLLSVSGVGPKMALGVVSRGRSGEVEAAILRGDAPFFTQVPGIGKKNAARIILELKAKLDQKGGLPASLGESFTGHSEVESALKNLGYRQKEIQEALKGIDPGLSLEEKIKAALSNL